MRFYSLILALLLIGCSHVHTHEFYMKNNPIYVCVDVDGSYYSYKDVVFENCSLVKWDTEWWWKK